MGKLAVITGASSGIGYNLAKVFAENGYDLVIASNGERLEKASSDFRQIGVAVEAIESDLATFDGVRNFWKQVEGLGRPVDAVAINAGVGVGGLFAETSLDEEINMVRLNVEGTMHLAKHVVQHMVLRGEGKILITASIAAEMIAPREAVYAATKAFDLSFAKSLRSELEGTGVSVTALQPGPVDTDFFHRAGMDHTQVGQEGKRESEPYDVAKQGFDALMAGEKHVYAASLKTKIEGAVANFVPDAVKAAMHEKMAKPVERLERRMADTGVLSRELGIGEAENAIPTDGQHYAVPDAEDGGGQTIARTIQTIQAEPMALYTLWRDVSSFPRWQEHVVSVTDLGGGKSHWVMGDPEDDDGRRIEFDSEITDDQPGTLISWRSITPEVKQTGTVTFMSTPSNRGTLVTLTQAMKVPGGTVGNAVAAVAKRSPRQTVIEDLRHFKQLAETGEIPSVKGQPHGPRGMIGSFKEWLYGETNPTPPRTGVD